MTFSWPTTSANVMMRSTTKFRVLDEVGCAAAAPKEMGVRGGEMVEEVFAAGKPIVADLEVLEQSFRSELDDGCSQNVPGGYYHPGYPPY
jgi:hypothetical protein